MEQISVTTPISHAIDRVKQVLFNPFDLGKWFTIGFCAWLAGLGESAGFIGLSTTLSLVPACIVVGAVGGLVWWGIKRLVE